MADIPDREQLEGRLARIFGRLSRAQMGRLLEELGDPPKVENVSAAFWDDAGKELASAIRPLLEDVYLESARRLMTENTSVGVEWGGVNEAAAEWASTHAYGLIRGINSTSRERVQGAVSRYYRDEQTIGELERSLVPSFGPVRAEMIAVTEVTRASVEGERHMVRELDKAGVQMRPFWETSNDEIARQCPICWPRHGKEITDGVYPPAHPRCRCMVGHQVVMPEEVGAGEGASASPKRQIRGEKYNIAELVDSAIAAVDGAELDLSAARQQLALLGNRNPNDALVTRFARETAILAHLARETGANFGGQIGKISFVNRDQAIASVNSYLNRRNAGHRARWTGNRR